MTNETAVEPPSNIEIVEAALAEAAVILDSPPPPDDGPQRSTTFREWIPLAASVEQWPHLETHIYPIYWQQARDHIARLVELIRQRVDISTLPPDLVARFHEMLGLYLTFGTLYCLNAMELVEKGGEERRARYDLTVQEKRTALLAILNGWENRNGGEPMPGLTWLLLNDRRYAAGLRISMRFFFEFIDAYVSLLRTETQTQAASVLLRSPSEPSIVAQDVWVRYVIRYHHEEMTIRKALIGLLRTARRAKASAHASRKEFWALRGINLVAMPGEVIGIVGRNGSGKTTFLKTLAGILGADRGRLNVRGTVGCLLSFGVGFKNNLSGRENIYLNGSILGLSRRQIDERLDRIIDFSELGDFIDAPVRTYSAGMRGRLGFSIAVNIDPDVLILDEVLSVGDAYFRDKAGSIIDGLHNANKTVIVASHSMDLIRKVSTRVIWIDGGHIRMEGTSANVTHAYVEDSRVKDSSSLD